MVTAGNNVSPIHVAPLQCCSAVVAQAICKAFDSCLNAHERIVDKKIKSSQKKAYGAGAMHRLGRGGKR